MQSRPKARLDRYRAYIAFLVLMFGVLSSSFDLFHEHSAAATDKAVPHVDSSSSPIPLLQANCALRDGKKVPCSLCEFKRILRQSLIPAKIQASTAVLYTRIVSPLSLVTAQSDHHPQVTRGPPQT